MITHAELAKFFYHLLFLTLVMLPVSTMAESDIAASNAATPNIKSKNMSGDLSTEAEGGVRSNGQTLQKNSSLDESFFSFMDKPQQAISSGVEIFAKSLDEFFSEDKVFYDASGTYLRLRLDSERDQNGNIRYAGNIRLKLRLPNTKKKLKFIVETDADKRQGDISTQTENTPANAVKNKDYFVGIQTSVGKENSWQFKPSLGLHLGSNIQLYTRLRLKRRYELEKWSVHWNETPFWFNSTGGGFDSYLEFNRKISTDTLFRASTFARWTNKTDYFELSQTFSMFHALSRRRAVSYYVAVNSLSKPVMFARYYVIGAMYRQNIHKDYLFVELIPQIKYQKINDFNAEFSLILRLEIIFEK